MKDFLRILPGIFISVLLLGIVFYSVDTNELKIELIKADYRYLPASVSFFLLSILARTFAWRTLLEGKVSFSKVFFTLNEGYFLNNVLPLRLGEVGRAFLLSRKTPLRFLEIIPTIMLERAFDVLIVVTILLATLPFVVGVEGATAKAFAVGGVVLLALLFLHILARNRERLISLFEKLREHHEILHRLGVSHVEAFFQGLAGLRDLRRFLWAFGWMLVAWGLLIGHYYLILLAFVPLAKVLWAAFGIAMVGLGVAVPSAPGSIGVVEATLVFVFNLFSVGRSKALAYSIVVHTIYLFITSLIGIYGLILDGDSLLNVYSEVRKRIQSSNVVS